MTIEWKILDKVTDEVVLTYNNRGKSSYRQSYFTSYANNLESFEDAFVDFLQNSSFIDLINSEPAKPKRQLSKDTLNSEGLIISQIKNPDFTSYLEMIKHASAASVAVLTDGGHGSGVIISKEGLMLTAYHVISGVNKIEVQFNTGLVLNAEVMAFDQESDIAILDITGSGYTALPFANEKAQLGDEVLTIGTPAGLDLGQSISKGILSGQRLIEGQKYIQSDLSISPGNSGGPLINDSGEIIGIIKSKIVGEGIEGIGFAIPISEVIKIMNIQQ